MKKILILTAIIVFFGFGVGAEPFLTCDPPATPDYCTHYQIYQDGVLIADNVPPQPDGRVLYDLEGTTPGQYVYTGKCCNTANDWGCSDFSNPTTSDPALSPGSGWQLVRQ